MLLQPTYYVIRCTLQILFYHSINNNNNCNIFNRDFLLNHYTYEKKNNIDIEEQISMNLILTFSLSLSIIKQIEHNA